jgi:hypothetical protein
MIPKAYGGKLETVDAVRELRRAMNGAANPEG